jgi:cytochrome b6-f complex iron-sulfur subunit
MADLVTKVWIEEGCIVCDACENACPEVFEVLDETCIIRPAAMNAEFTKPLTESIIEAAEECPVDVIKFETIEGEAPASAPAPAEPVPATAEAAAPAEKPAVAAAVKEAPEPKPTAPAKSPEKQPKVSVAGAPDPAIQALLRAATSRGGPDIISRREAEIPESSQRWKGKSPSELPPDARNVKVMQATKKAAEEEDGVSRRMVLGTAAMGLGWFSIGAYGAVSGLAFQRFMMPNVLEEPDPEVRVGRLEKYVEMKPGDVNEDYKPKGIWMIRLEDRIAALNIICTHLGCIPNWLPNERKFKCPCHGSGYRQDGVNFEGPTPRPLERFKIFVIDGEVHVDTSKKYQYEKGQWDNPDSFLSI